MLKTLTRTSVWLGAAALLALPVAQADELQQQAQALFGRGEAPPPSASLAEAGLGRQLFFDARIGADGTNCGTCHQFEQGGADGRKTAVGAFGRVGKRNTPTIVDIVPQVGVHWIGDRESLADQAIRSLTAPPAYAHSSREQALQAIRAQPDLQQAFTAVYADGITLDNWGRALAAYQEHLTTESAFDRYLQGDLQALTGEQTHGLQVFINTGCAGCHNGRLLGGTSYQRFGVVEDYTRHTHSEADSGRRTLTGLASDERVFKVPPLRHAAQTAPYFHDGSVERLEDAVRIMARVQLGQTLSADDVAAITTFLQATTAAMPEALQQP